MTGEEIVFGGWIGLSKPVVWRSEVPLGLDKRGWFLVIAAGWDVPSAISRSKSSGSGVNSGTVAGACAA